MYDVVAGPLFTRSLIIWGVWTFAYFALICLNLVLIDSYSIGDCDFMFGYLALASGVEFFGILFAIQFLYMMGRVTIQVALYLLAALLLLLYAIVYTYTDVSDAALAMLFLAKVALPAAIAVTWVHCVEMFPTELRASGHSLAAIMGRFGSFAAVYWIDDYASYDGNTLPGSIFYIGAAFFVAVLVLLLPETSGVKLDVASAATTMLEKPATPPPTPPAGPSTGAAAAGVDEDDSDAMNVMDKRFPTRTGEEQTLLGKEKRPQNFPLGFK